MKNMPGKKPLTVCVPVLSETNFWSWTPRMSEARAWEFASMEYEKHNIRFTCSQCGSHFSSLDSAWHSPTLWSAVTSKHACAIITSLWKPQRIVCATKFGNFLNIAKNFHNFAVDDKGGQEWWCKVTESLVMVNVIRLFVFFKDFTVFDCPITTWDIFHKRLNLNAPLLNASRTLKRNLSVNLQ